MGLTNERLVGVPQTVKTKYLVNLGSPVPTILAFLVTFFAIEKSNSQSERQRCETALKSMKNCRFSLINSKDRIAAKQRVAERSRSIDFGFSRVLACIKGQ